MGAGPDQIQLLKRMKARSETTFWRPWRIACLLLLAAIPSAAQRVIEMRGFKFSEDDDAPQETKVKIRLEGAKAQPLQGGLVLVSEARVRTFREDGLPELVIEAPDCTHNSTNRTMSSSGPLLVKTADGSFSIRGNGFLYQQTNRTLFISNNVETIASPELLKQSGTNHSSADQDSPLRILSQTFRYSTEDGIGLYRENVRVSGTNLAVSSERLTLTLPITERVLRSITAEDNVHLDYADMDADGQKAVYDVATEVAEMTGQPSWRSEGREGGADTFIIDRTNRLVLAKGDAWLKMPGQSLAADLLPRLNNPEAPATGQSKTVEVRSASYQLQTNQIVFLDGVKLSETADGMPDGQLTCGKMIVNFAGTNQLEKLVAEKDVAIERPGGRFAANLAVYTATNSLLELHGDPSWLAGLRRGRGDLITVDTFRNEMHVKGNASMQMPAEALREQAGQQNPKLRVSGASVGQAPAEIFSDEYFVSPERALFQGGVRITHPQMAWSCETLTVDLPPEGMHVESVLAQRQVVFNFIDNSGQVVKGAAEKALYQYKVSAGVTNEQMELTGNPLIQTTNGVFRNRVIVYDMTRDKFDAFGRYAIHAIVPVMKTNTFKFPK